MYHKWSSLSGGYSIVNNILDQSQDTISLIKFYLLSFYTYLKKTFEFTAFLNQRHYHSNHKFSWQVFFIWSIFNTFLYIYRVWAKISDGYVSDVF